MKMSKEEAQKKAEEKYPYPLKMCVLVKKKIDWLRAKYIEENS